MVDIRITGVHLDVSEQVKEHIHRKVGALTRFHRGLSKVSVTIHPADKRGYRVDVDMHLGHHRDVVAHDSEPTILSAIDLVTDKCAAQLRRIHGRSAEHARPPQRIAI